MISQYLASIDGIGILGVGMLLLSLVVFLAVVVRAARADAGYLATMRRLPLDVANERPEQSSEEQR